MSIDIYTRFVMLIGKPLKQSFAARLQNAAFEAAGLNMRYFYNEAGAAHLKEILDGLRYTSSMAGAAVTYPNTLAVMDYLDDVNPLCRKMGSCNTIVKDEQDRLIGFNTDCLGFLESFMVDGNFDPAGKTFFCVGAGGAGRALCSALAHAGADRIYVTDLVDVRAHDLARDINENFAPVAEAAEYGDYSLIRTSDCVMNATGVGMGSTIGQSPVPARALRYGQFCYDACYNPERTQFLLDAEASGCDTLNGLSSSVRQGAMQVKLWAGVEPPLPAMFREMRAILREHG